jgi:hypothetical protein
MFTVGIRRIRRATGEAVPGSLSLMKSILGIYISVVLDPVPNHRTRVFVRLRYGILSKASLSVCMDQRPL